LEIDDNNQSFNSNNNEIQNPINDNREMAE